MTEQEWSFGDVDGGDHFIEAAFESGRIRLAMNEQDVLIVRDMLNRVVNQEGYDAAEAFGTDDWTDEVVDRLPSQSGLKGRSASELQNIENTVTLDTLENVPTRPDPTAVREYVHEYIERALIDDDPDPVTDGGARYAYSRLTDTWYKVTEYDELGDGKIRARAKEPVDREDVPQDVLDATEERGDGPDPDPEHDAPVEKQLTDRQRELVEDDGGPDDA